MISDPFLINEPSENEGDKVTRKVMVMFLLGKKIDLNYTIVVKELKQELKQNRVELPQPPLKTNLERTIYDTCLKL